MRSSGTEPQQGSFFVVYSLASTLVEAVFSSSSRRVPQMKAFCFHRPGAFLSAFQGCQRRLRTIPRSFFLRLFLGPALRAGLSRCNPVKRFCCHGLSVAAHCQGSFSQIHFLGRGLH
jgi:hypothetical protein